MGDGATLLEFHSKMNSIDDQIIEMMNKALDETEKNFRGLVIGNDGVELLRRREHLRAPLGGEER